ncbi:hypothetical protein DFH09DRAFT_1459228 [Mycena vulgaris]|nr:hypothetical protein DFH09DRAFT_1459228 [Mycena vulgaris]
MPHPSVLIAGAGPSGLVLALILLKNGVRVRIIDKERTHRVGSRGADIIPRTLELCATLGVLDDILKDALEILPTVAYDFGELVPKSTTRLLKYQEPTLDVPHSNGAALSQDRHEEILRTHLAKLPYTVELGAELRSFEQSADSVVARIVKTAANGIQSEETATFEWLQLGLSFLGKTRTDVAFALGDIVIEEGLDSSGRICRGILHTDGPARDQFGETTWLSNYMCRHIENIRMVDTMRQGRVFIAGDAAHCHSPAGGQGLNSSVQDAANLGWKLALVHKGLVPTFLLDTESEERHRVIAHMLGITTAIIDKATGEIGAKDFKMQHGDGMRMLGVNYRGSSIVCEEEGAAGVGSDAYTGGAPGRVQAAYHAPDAPELVAAGTQNAATRLFEVFSASAHTVLVLGGDAEAWAPVVDALARIPPGVMRAVLLLGQGHVPPKDAPKFDGPLSSYYLTGATRDDHGVGSFGWVAVGNR